MAKNVFSDPWILMGKAAAGARGGNPEYVVERHPVIGEVVDVLWYQPDSVDDLTRGAYRKAFDVTPTGVLRGCGEDIDWFRLSENEFGVTVFYRKNPVE